MRPVCFRRRWRGLGGIGLVAGVGALVCGCGGAAPAAPDGSVAGVDGSDAGTVVAAPDLRFKWVGAAFTLKASEFTNGGTGTGQLGWHGQEFFSELTLSGEATTWYYMFKTVENLETMAGLATGGSLSAIETDLDGLRDPRGIITSLDSGDFGVDPPGYVYNALLIRTDSNSVTYDPFTRGAVTPDGLAAWAAEEGSRGVVVTALGPEARGADASAGTGLVYVAAFGRQGDTATYETQVAVAPFDALGAQLNAMAAGGYIITALGRDGTGIDGAGNFIAVGTRVAGQSSPRAITIVDAPCITGAGGDPGGTALHAMLADGYALVGEIFHSTSGNCDGTPSWALIGER